MATKEITVPDLEGSTDVGVVEVYINKGDSIDVESPLISLESDKAVMDVPAPIAGVITEIKVSEGDTVNAGDVIALVEVQDNREGIEAVSVEKPEHAGREKSQSQEARTDQADQIVDITVPDLEGSTDVAIVEVYVSAGDDVVLETPLVSLESDKAVMDVPSPVLGKIEELKVSEGDTVNTGDIIARARVASNFNMVSESRSEPEDPPSQKTDATEPARKSTDSSQNDTVADSKDYPINFQKSGATVHATPSLRQFARELGVDLSTVLGTGPKGRITRDDVTGLVKSVMSGQKGTAPSGSFQLPPIPTDDFAAYGSVESQALSRVQKISGPHLHRNWLGIPHVTQFEEADITDLETFRKELNAEAAKSGGPRISPLIPVIKAVVTALKAFPDFNSSLGPDGATIIRKAYYNIGIAVDTPGGLVVPVIKSADQKGIRQLAEELADLSSRARDGKLKVDEMKGAGFSISSLGGIGGTFFTPIVNAPEVAILGLSRSAMKPVWNGSEFVPRLMLPLSVSYDHRVIDGAQGARFTVYLAQVLADLRRALV